MSEGPIRNTPVSSASSVELFADVRDAPGFRAHLGGIIDVETTRDGSVDTECGGSFGQIEGIQATNDRRRVQVIGHGQERVWFDELTCGQERHAVFLLKLGVRDERDAESKGRIGGDGVANDVLQVPGHDDGFADAFTRERAKDAKEKRRSRNQLQRFRENLAAHET